MAMRKIGVGTLVSVEQESTGRGRRRPSEGGIGFVVKRKKQQCMEDKNGETPVVELTQQSTTSTTTAGTGATMFDIRSQHVRSYVGKLEQPKKQSYDTRWMVQVLIKMENYWNSSMTSSKSKVGC